MKHGLVTLVVRILKDTSAFQVVSLLCAWNITTVEINRASTYVKVNPLINFRYICSLCHLILTREIDGNYIVIQLYLDR